MRNLIFICVFLIGLSSCFKEEDKRDSAFSNYSVVPLGPDYETQFFYNLSSNTIVSSNEYAIWDIGLYSKNDKSCIRLNNACNFYVIKTGSTDFNQVYNIDSYAEEAYRYDGTSALTQDLAIDETLDFAFSNDTVYTNKEVYLISSGVDAAGNEIQTPKKFVFEGIYESSYIIRYAELDGNNEQRKIVPRDETLNLTAFSFEEGSSVNVEPDVNTWDIMFSRWTDTVYSSDSSLYLMGYAVTGAYLNPTFTKSYIEKIIPYDEISIQDVDETRLTNKLNVIGHSWKYFGAQYTILPDKTYILQDANGIFYKLHFLGFYDEETGHKGYPSFELEVLL